MRIKNKRFRVRLTGFNGPIAHAGFDDVNGGMNQVLKAHYFLC